VGALQLGYNLSTSAAAGADPVADGRAVEALGFDFVSVSDHLHGEHPTFETWTVLTWVAAATERVALVPNVLGLPYRPVPVLAKMAETLHRLSGGRLVLGLGAGGADHEFEAFGVQRAATGGEKLADLDDALRALRALWSSPSVDLDGRALHLRGAQVSPRPDTPIPVWVGGYGPRMLDLIGRHADGWLPSMPFVPPERFPDLRDAVRRASEAAGRDPDAVTRAYNVGAHVGRRIDGRPVVSGETADEVAARLAGLVVDLSLDAVNLWPSGREAEQRPLLGEVAERLRGAVG